MKTQKASRWVRPAIAVFAALAAIVAGALWLIAPVWQPGYRADRPAFVPPEPDKDTPAAVPAAPGKALIDVNTATAEELTSLPGIGAAKAAAIVAWRDEHGPFAALADMSAVDGISARMTENWDGLAIAGPAEK